MSTKIRRNSSSGGTSDRVLQGKSKQSFDPASSTTESYDSKTQPNSPSKTPKKTKTSNNNNLASTTSNNNNNCTISSSSSIFNSHIYQVITRRLTNPQKPNKDGKLLLDWFLGLTPEERGRVLSFEDKEGVWLIRQMYKTKKKEGEGLFFAVEDPALLKLKSLDNMNFAPDVDFNFCFKKLNSFAELCFYSQRLLDNDKILEESVRLCDTREYLDTMTVAVNLLEDGKEFLQLMWVATRGNFLTSHCKVSWDASKKKWNWDVPKWFQDMGYYSLGTFIAHKLEKILWVKYWDSHKLDPRSKISSLTYTFPSNLEGLLSKTYLVNFWKNIDIMERRRIVGSFGNIIQHVLTNNDFSSNFSTSSKASVALDYPKMLSALVDLSSQEKSLELLFNDNDLAENEKAFINILYFSPLERAELPIDLVLRRVGMSIHSAYSEKICMDLIVGDEADKLKNLSQQQENKKKKRNKKKKLKKLKEQEKKVNHNNNNNNNNNSSGSCSKEKVITLEEQKKKKEISKKIHAMVLEEIVTRAEIIIREKKLKQFQESLHHSTSNSTEDSENLPSSDHHHQQQQNNTINHSQSSTTTTNIVIHHNNNTHASTNSKRKNKKKKKKSRTNFTTMEDIPSGLNSAVSSPTSVSAPSSPTQTRKTPPPGLDLNFSLSRSSSHEKQQKSRKKSLTKEDTQSPNATPAGQTPQHHSLAGKPAGNSLHPHGFQEELIPQSPPPIPLSARGHIYIIETNHLPRVAELVKKISYLVDSVWSGARVEIYGSYATLLCTPSSDVDLVVFGAKTSNNSTMNSRTNPPVRFIPTNSINVLAKMLQQTNWITNIQVIETAKVPVIKLVSSSVNGVSISIDISFNEESDNAPIYCSSVGLFSHSGIAARELVKDYIRKMPELVHLILVLKQLLIEKGLNNTFIGGLSSYCLVLMAISYLQIYGKLKGLSLDDTSRRFTRLNFGVLLLEFLELYGTRFDFASFGITIQNGGSHFPLDSNNFQFPQAPLVIVDPFNPSNNLGQHARGIWRVQAAFASAYKDLLAALSQENPSEHTFLNKILRDNISLPPLVTPQYIPQPYILESQQHSSSSLTV